MKRRSNFFEEICSWDNLRRAWYKASKGKRTKPDVIRFRENLDRNLLLVRETLYNPYSGLIGNYRFFKIFDPKERQICEASFTERVLHHALINILEPCFESVQIFDSYACRKTKGTDAALRRALYYSRIDKWVLKLDVRRYFDSIDHAVLEGLILRKIKDRRVLPLLMQIIRTYQKSPGKGVPIGNLTSQFFANHYLSSLDHYIKETLKPSGYLRYMDDMLLFTDSLSRIHSMENNIRAFCMKDLHLSLKQPLSVPTSAGVPFLGFLVKAEGIYLTRKKRERAFRHMQECSNRYRKEEIDQQQLSDHILPICAHLSIARSRHVRNTLIQRAGLGQ